MRKTLMAAVCGVMTAFVAHAQTVVMTIDLAAKTVEIEDTISIRETVPVQIVNLGNSSAANLTLRILDNDGIVYAQKVGFSDAGNDVAYGEIDLNTQELVDYFADTMPQVQRAFTLGLWDTSLNRLLINDVVTIQNNPYSSGMAGPSPVGVDYMVVTNYDADANGKVDTSDALEDLLAAPPWMPSGTNDGVQAGVATNSGAGTWVTFPVAYTGSVNVVASPSDDFEYEATVKVHASPTTTGFAFTVSSAAGDVTNAWRVNWIASPATADSGGGGYTDARAVAAVSNVLGTAAWRDVGTDDDDLPTYADVVAIAGGADSLTNATLAWGRATNVYGTASVVATGRVARITLDPLPNAWEGLYYSVNYPGGPWLPSRLNVGITNGGVTSAKILDGTVTLADIADSAENTLTARAGNVFTGSNNTFVAGTTQAFSSMTAGTATVTRLNMPGPELCGDSYFMDGDAWTYDTNYWTLDYGALFYQGSGSTSKAITKDIGAIAGRTYTVTYEYYLEGVGVQFRASVGGNSGTLRLGSGTYTDTITAGASGLLAFTVTTLLGGEAYALVSSVRVYDTNSDIVMTNGVINVGGRTVTWDKIALWDAGGAGAGTATNATHLGGVAAASYALDSEVATAVGAHNTNASAHTALFAAKQNASTAATDAELSAHNTNATAHATQFSAKQPLDSDLTKLATNNGGSLTNLQPFRTAWKLAYGNGSSQWTEIGLGSAGSYLRANGNAAAPSWHTPNLSATATNVSLADLTDTFTNGSFVVGNGTNLTQRTVAQVQAILGTDTDTGIPDLAPAMTNAMLIATNGTAWAAVTLEEAQAILGVGEATNVLFSNWQDSGTSNDVAVSHGGTTWTHDPFLDVMERVVAGAGGWYSFGIDATMLDGKDSTDFLETTTTLDDISDVDVAGIAAGQTLAWSGTEFVPTNQTVDTATLEAMWQADDATMSNALKAAYGAADTALSNATRVAYLAADAASSNATRVAYRAADTTLSNALVTAFYTGYTNVTLARIAGDAAVSNYVNSTVAGYVKKNGTTAMTGNLNMGGYSITNIAASSLAFVGGATVSAEKVAKWDAGSMSDTVVSNLVAGKVSKAGDLTQFTALGGTAGQVFKSNGSGGGAWGDDNSGGTFATLVRAYATAPQTMTATGEGTANLYLFGGESFDLNNDFASSLFVVPENGYYQVDVSIPVDLSETVTTGERVGIALKVNGITYYQQRPFITAFVGEITMFVHIDEVLQLSAGQTMGVYVWKETQTPVLQYSTGYVGSINIRRVM